MSKIEVNAVEPQCGTTLTLGASGDTITIPSGATITNNGTQTGFGRTGTVDWQTTVKTATFTAADGEGYFCNTTSSAFTVNLPAGTAGSIVSVQDYNNSFDSNTLTIQVNGTQKINGGTASGNIELNTEGEGLTLVYIDDTVGWRSIHNSNFTDQSSNAVFVAASGGNATVTCGNFKTHIFTGPGTFTVSCAGNACGSNSVEYLVVAGGGGGGEGQPADSAGGGGAGGFRLRTSLSPASPLNAPANLPVSAQAYPITVGAGGAGTTSEGNGSNGANSIFSTITSTGGGGGNFGASPGALPGGSGGGTHQRAAGAGNTPPVSPPQGNPGGSSGPNPDGSAPQTPNGGGGGGASAAGSGGVTANGGPGGAGSFIPTSFVGPTAPSYGETGPAGRYFAGGGAGGTSPTRGGQGTGSGGLGGGGDSTLTGTENTGGGGGGSDMSAPGGRQGGSGIVMIRYKFQ